MKSYSGKSVFSGIAFGKVLLIKKPALEPDKTPCESAEEEIKKFDDALAIADSELEELSNKVRIETGEEEAQIIELQRSILQDGDFLDKVNEFINTESNKAAWAVFRAGKYFFDFFESLDDPYMNARSADVADASERVCSILLGSRQIIKLEKPSVIIADDLSPSQTLQMDKNLIRAFVTQKGSSTSHTAIIARTFNIPSLVQADIPLEDWMHDKDAAVDAHEGNVYLEPAEETIRKLEAKQEEDKKLEAELLTFKDLPTVTQDGKNVELYANIGSVEDLDAVLKYGAEGIGLFRSEFLFLGRDKLPSEDEQFEAYRKAAEALGGRRVVIRTLDIGADKQAPYLGLEIEENPALGCRAIRLCFSQPEILVTQLRALYRASAFGKIAIMFPMITSL